MPKNKEAFVETPPEQGGPARPQRLSLRLTDQGTIDWDSASERQKQLFAESVSKDPDALEMIGLAAGGGEGESPELGGGSYVKPEHVRMALDGYAKVTAFLIPKYVARRSKGKLVISPEIASEAFRFTEEQKDSLSPDGAAWANEAIPESWRQWFFENVGPGLKFFGLLFMVTMQQTQHAIEIAKKSQPNTSMAVDVQPVATGGTNGHAEAGL